MSYIDPDIADPVKGIDKKVDIYSLGVIMAEIGMRQQVVSLQGEKGRPVKAPSLVEVSKKCPAPFKQVLVFFLEGFMFRSCVGCS